jgi:hypothetical protein
VAAVQRATRAVRMSHTESVVYRCDRCQKRAEVAQGEVPSGWRCVSSLPLASPEPTLPLEWELCDQCSGQVSRLLEPVERVADMQARPAA